MKIFEKISNRILDREIAKGKSLDFFIKKYTITRLEGKKLLTKFENTCFYVPDVKSKVLAGRVYNPKALYTKEGEYIGNYVFRDKGFLPENENDYSKYVIVEGKAEFQHTNETTSYAVYDKDGKCIIPQGCYQTVYATQDYILLSMKPETKFETMALRIPSDQDESCIKLIGDVINPRVLIINKETFKRTDFLAIAPAPTYYYNGNGVADYENKTIWIANKGLRTVSCRIDKSGRIRETAKLDRVNLNGEKSFYFDDNENAVYYIDMHGNRPRRTNLKTGEVIDLVTLKAEEKEDENKNKLGL